MGKRSSFKRRKNDSYDTPPEAVAPLLPHLPETFTYWEPCAGNGSLIDALSVGNCVAASDIEPRPREGHHFIVARDALWVGRGAVDFWGADFIISNPPWTREILHPMIDRFSWMRPTWLLFDADWMHTKQAVPYLKKCRKIVSVGRVKWIKDSPHTGKDNVSWYLFTRDEIGKTEFFGRS